MNWNQFFDEVKAGKIANVYLFTGPEAHIRESALSKLREALLPEGLEMLNETVMEEASAQAVIEACETMPVMTEKRLVVVRDYAPLMPGKAKDEEAESERLIGWLPTAPDTCCLVFFMRDAFDGRKKLASRLVKMGAQVVFGPLDDAALEKWLAKEARQRGGDIRPDAARQLVFLAGRSLTRLGGELDKLCAYAGQQNSVTREMVDKLVTPSLEATVFQMIDSLMDGRMDTVFSCVKTMLQAGESRIGILFMLTRQMRLLTHIKRMKAEGGIMPQIEKDLSLNHYAAGRMERQASRFSLERLQEGYEMCVKADYAIKSGKAREEAALDRVLFMLGKK